MLNPNDNRCAAVVGYKMYTDYKAEQAYQIEYNKYIDNLETVRLLMLTGGGKAEKLCNLTAKVWYNSIYDVDDSETDEYTKYEYQYKGNTYTKRYSDFNDALSDLYLSNETRSTISNIESNQSLVKSYEICHTSMMMYEIKVNFA